MTIVLPQLMMVHDLSDLPETMPIPDGYTLRVANLEDATQIGEVLHASFKDPWPPEKVDEYLLKNVNVPKTFVIENEGRLVAHASYQLKPANHPEAGWVHFVGVDPAHSGKRLGLAVTWAATREALLQKKSESRLSTDDFRLPAIRTYLRLGFRPDPYDESHPTRWSSVLEELSSTSDAKR